MLLKLLILPTLFCITVGQLRHNYSCSFKSALDLLKRPAHEFSTRILYRVAEHNNPDNFVFSPISTWLQLIALADGADGIIQEELWNVTGHHRQECFKNKLKDLLRKQTKGLDEYRRRSLIIIDKIKDVNKSYIRKVAEFYTIKILLEDFGNPVSTADKVNKDIAESTNGIIKESVNMYDFNKTVMLLSDNLYYKNLWNYSFDITSTKKESFKNIYGVDLGDVNMMNYIGYLYVANMSNINATVLEIPCAGDFSMLILKPMRYWEGDIYYFMKDTRIMSIVNDFKKEGKKLVHVKLPRFRINSTVDNLDELLIDMGVKRPFLPKVSTLPNISKYKLYVSLMAQVADIEVTEKGETAPFVTEINEMEEKVDFFADRPFAYMIVERKTQFIYFAGTYSQPSVH